MNLILGHQFFFQIIEKILSKKIIQKLEIVWRKKVFFFWNGTKSSNVAVKNTALLTSLGDSDCCTDIALMHLLRVLNWFLT